MPALSRTFATALTVAMVATLVVSVAGAADASLVAAPATVRTVDADHAALDLGGDAVVPHRAGRAARIQKWNVRTLYYYETLPAKWDWSLSTAVAKWNASGARIRLARTASSTRAQVRVGYANIGSAAGLATVGATRNAFVHLSSRFAGWDGVNARNRVIVMNVLAHELGHVFGFQHTSARCSLMAPVIDVDACNTVPSSEPGRYRCRTIDTTLARRFIKLYGGRARYPSGTWCLIDPLPPVLTGVTFTGGTSDPVTVRWTPPRSVPAGTNLVLKRWEAATCGTAPAWATPFRPSLASGVWHDQVTDADETDCFQLQLLNRYGAGRPAQMRVLARWVPPLEAPVIGTPSYDFAADRFAFPAIVPGGATLQARWDTLHPGTCVTEPTGGNFVEFVPVAGGQGTLTAPAALPQCVSFFAYDQETHRYSAPVTVTFTEPVPPAPVVGTPVWDPVTSTFHAPASHPAGTDLVYAVDEQDPGACPDTYTSGSVAVEDPDRLGPGVVEFTTTHTDQCVSFFTLDDQTGQVSERTIVLAVAPPG